MLVGRTTKTVGFTVPPAMAEDFERLAEKKQRTKSELFREMFRFYRTYHKALERAEEERFERLIDEAIAEGLQKKENPTTTIEEDLAESKRLARYGARQAKKLGIDTSEEGINRIIREERDKRQREYKKSRERSSRRS